MIFGRKRKARDHGADPEEERPDPTADTDGSSTADLAGPGAAGTDGSGTAATDEAATDWRGAAPDDPWVAVDARDWRQDGPFDIDEVDLEGDPVGRMDLGAMVITPIDGMEVRFQVEQSSARATAVLLLHGESAMELSVYAAPRSGGLWADVRQEVAQLARQQGGTAELAEGPFGVEVRRMMPVATPDGQQGLQPTRMLMIEGPRWALRAVVYGRAAIDYADEAVTAELREVLRDTVVRRGDLPMPPGSIMALTLPPELDEQIRSATQAETPAQPEAPTEDDRRTLPDPSGQSTAIQG
ncbi:DUF3710 domain-containing protein [Raineyella sp. LH-20]|uniref:DUF3710 domain-containing protein n=1 Tax=Raineyella sp. LH-20 TaxID=3081204 RepID=UPI0029530E1C|nr:DUF3710 domain-containing protein [Raineyella sp. LH-20]WOP18077.1 DUF3710 domain-containing protein [Raineyella sp. LH-20]